MNAYATRNCARLLRSPSATILTALFLLFMGAPNVHANDRTKCQRATEKAEMKLDEAIEAHGSHSHEAAEKMEDLRKQREHCYERFQEWWDGREQRWHDDRDFGHDLHRHDRDRDRDR